MLRKNVSVMMGLGLLVALVITVAAAPVAAAPPMAKNFVAVLSGSEEVPPVDTNARGLAKFQLSADGMELRFKLIVANIDDVVAAHIHCGAVGVNGPVGVTLFAGGPDSSNGILAQDVITAPDAGNACGWMTFGDVIDAIMTGDTYVNVHTLANPGGEIRGQVMIAGPR